MEKYGFIYIWYDRKHKRYYVGCHWGTEKDGYICSSVWMKNAYKKRPHDFKRRILRTNINCRKQLLLEEYKWLQQIKDEELGIKYYNKFNSLFGHWSLDPEKAKIIIQKSSEANKGRVPWNKNKKGQYTEKQLEKIGKWIRTDQTRQKLSEAKLGKPLKKKKRILTDDIRARMGHMKGKTVPREMVEIRRASIKKLKWITNGIVDRRTSKPELPEGFYFGRTHNNPPKWWEKNTTCTSSIDD